MKQHLPLTTISWRRSRGCQCYREHVKIRFSLLTLYIFITVFITSEIYKNGFTLVRKISQYLVLYVRVFKMNLKPVGVRRTITEVTDLLKGWKCERMRFISHSYLRGTVNRWDCIKLRTQTGIGVSGNFGIVHILRADGYNHNEQQIVYTLQCCDDEIAFFIVWKTNSRCILQYWRIAFMWAADNWKIIWSLCCKAYTKLVILV